MIKKPLLIGALSALLLLFSVAPSLAKEVAAQAISYVCNGCHRTNDSLAKLKGQDAEKLAKALVDFKYDNRQSSIMGRISKGFTDTELKNVALYFSLLKGKE